MSPSKPSRKSPGRTRPTGTPAQTGQATEVFHGLEIEIHHLRQLFCDTLKAYGVGIESEIAQLADSLREGLEESGPALSSKQEKILRQMVTLIRKVNIRPEKGRRKDLKRIEEAVAQLSALAEKWQWTE